MCQSYRHRVGDRQWHQAHPDYDVERRLRILDERLKHCRDPGEVVQQESEPLRRLPADSVQSEFGLGGLAVLVMLGRLVVRHSQDEITSQVLEITEQIGN